MRTIDKILIFIRNRLGALVALTIFWVLIFTIKEPLKLKQYTYVEQNGSIQGTTIGEITSDKVIYQNFLAKKNNLIEIGVFVLTYSRENTSTLIIKLKNNEGTIVAEKQYDSSVFSDGAWINLECEQIEDSAENVYTLEIYSPDAEEGNAVTLGDMGSNEDYNAVCINEKEQLCSLAYQLTYVDEENSLLLNFINIGLWVLLIGLSFFCACRINGIDERSFLYISLCLGSIFLVLTAFPHAVDESTHFFRSFAISRGQLTDSWKEETIGAYLTADYSSVLSKKLNIVSLVQDYEFWSKSFSDETAFVSNAYMSSVIPTGHFIAAIGIAIGNLFHMSRWMVVLLARITDFAVYNALCYLAIKKATYYKSVFFVVSLLPINIWLAASCSQDPIVNAAALLFISLCIKYYFEEQNIRTGDYVLMAICSLLFCSVKYCIYAPLLVLIILLPKKIRRTKRHRIFTIAISLIVICMACLQIWFLKEFPFKEDRNGDVDVARQIKYVVSNLFVSYQNFTTYFVENFWTHIEGLSRYNVFSFVPRTIGIVGVIGNGVLCKDKYIGEKANHRFACVLSGICIVIFFLIIGALYVGFTPVGKFGVDGLQTRYILPFVVLIMIALSTINIKNECRNYNQFLSILMIIGILNELAGNMLEVF